MIKVEQQKTLSLLTTISEKLLKKTKTKAIQELGEKQIKAIESGVEKQLLDMDEKLIAALFSEGFFTKKPEGDIIKIIKAEKITWYRLFNL